MEGADQTVAMLLFTLIGGAVGARLARSEYWRGAISTGVAIFVTGAIFVAIGSNNLFLSAVGLLFAMTVICGALRMKGMQIVSTILGAYLGMIGTGALYSLTGIGAG